MYLSVIDDAGRFRRGLSRTAVAVLGLCLVLLVAVAHAAPARAYELQDFTGTVLRPPAPDDGPDGPHYADLAGEHPDTAVVDFSFKTGEDHEPIGVTRDVRVDIPAGLIPNPAAFPTCTNDQLNNEDWGAANGVPSSVVTDPDAGRCPIDSQVGVINLTVTGTILQLPDRNTLTVQLPVYNMTRSAGQIGRFAFLSAQSVGSSLVDGDIGRVDIIGGVRPSDNGLFFTIHSPESLRLVHSKLSFWGTPGLASHDADRSYASTTMEHGLLVTDEPVFLGFVGGNAPFEDRKRANYPFLTNPTACAGVLRTTVRSDTYPGTDGDGNATPSEQASAFFDTPYGAQDCEHVPFQPTVSFGSDQPIVRDASAALNVSLKVPQAPDSDTRGTAQLKDVAVTLPAGFSISPSGANGLQTCSDAQLAAGTSDPVACPAASKVGTVSIDSPVIDSPLQGAVYVGQSQPGDRYRLFVVAEGHGVSIRLKGSARPDPRTGQVTATFTDNPQLPFSELELRFRGDSHGIIAAPQTCGGTAGNAVLSPFSGTPAVTGTADVAIAGCADGFPFLPAFGASVGSSQAGAYTPLTVAFGRPDGSKYLSGVGVTLPPGQLAKLRGVGQCAEAQIAAEACPAASRIGDVQVQAGPGADPYALSGSMYLTGGYDEGQFGAVTIIRAVAGPYDLGNVVVRQSIRIDPNDAQVSIASDPLPQIKEGIPLRVRNLTLRIDRPGFTRNATSCGPGRVEAGLRSLDGTTVAPAVALGRSGCDRQAFRPKLALTLRNATQMRKNQHPLLTATVTQREGEAGLRSTSVALPKDVALAADNAKGLCEVAQAAADTCPPASMVGNATAVTPILGKPLKGPVYFVKGERKDARTGRVIKTLPTLFIPLRGEATIYLRAETAVSHGRLVTTLPAIPDAPISTFTLKINGGKHGIIANTRDLCGTSKGTLRGSARFVGQNGKKAATQRPRIGTACRVAKKHAPAKQ